MPGMEAKLENGMETPRPRTILIIDHEILIRAALAQYLRDCGFAVVEVATGEEAQTVLSKKSAQIDIALIDLTPGTADSFKLVHWLRRNYPELPNILVGSPASAAEAAGELCEKGPLAKKPYDHQLLLDRIRQLLGEAARTTIS